MDVGGEFFCCFFFEFLYASYDFYFCAGITSPDWCRCPPVCLPGYSVVAKIGEPTVECVVCCLWNPRDLFIEFEHLLFYVFYFEEPLFCCSVDDRVFAAIAEGVVVFYLCCCDEGAEFFEFFCEFGVVFFCVELAEVSVVFWVVAIF